MLFFECVGIPSINNALKWFKSKGILTTQSVVIGKSTFLTQSRGQTVSVFQLAESYRDKQEIDGYINVIGSYRYPTTNHNDMISKL